MNEKEYNNLKNLIESGQNIPLSEKNAFYLEMIARLLLSMTEGIDYLIDAVGNFEETFAERPS